MQTVLTVQGNCDVKTPSTSSVKLTIVGRSAPCFIRQAKSSAQKLPIEAHHIVQQSEHQPSTANEACYSVLIPSTPVAVRFFRQRLGAGLRTLAGTILGISLGAYLATEIATSHPLQAKVAFVSAVYCLLGIALIPITVRELFGVLKVDSYGISVTPGLVGFTVPWDDLERWTIDGTAFRFHSRKSGVTESVRIDQLSPQNRQILIDTLKACASQRERSRPVRRAEPALSGHV
ncbi:MAG: hypothetical protein U0936_06620 [Planctomycetaceae bacterium]